LLSQIIFKHDRQQFEDSVAEVGLGLVRSVLNADNVEDEPSLLLVLDGADVNLFLFELNLNFPFRSVITDAPHILRSIAGLRGPRDDHVPRLDILP
jgi:hypothetical protein